MANIRARIKSGSATFWAEESELTDEHLSGLCDKFFDDEEGAAASRIVAAINEYLVGVQGKKALPSASDEKHDLEQLLATINELDRRLTRFPARAEAHAYTAAQGRGVDWHDLKGKLRDELKQFRQITGYALARGSCEPVKTNPGKYYRDKLISDLATIFDDFTEYEETPEYSHDRNDFVSEVLKVIGERPPVDLSKILRQAKS